MARVLALGLKDMLPFHYRLFHNSEMITNHESSIIESMSWNITARERIHPILLSKIRDRIATCDIGGSGIA